MADSARQPYFKMRCKITLIFSALLFSLNSVLPQNYPKAQCLVSWSIRTGCGRAKTAIKNQMDNWKETDIGASNCPERSRKCRYIFEGFDKEGSITGHHVTSILLGQHSYKNRISFEFSDDDNNCKVVGFSKSTDDEIYFDFGANYCSLKNLLDGANLLLQNEFSESTSKDICTQLDKANCE